MDIELDVHEEIAINVLSVPEKLSKELQTFLITTITTTATILSSSCTLLGKH
jgi:hypothetical protein